MNVNLILDPQSPRAFSGQSKDSQLQWQHTPLECFYQFYAKHFALWQHMSAMYLSRTAVTDNVYHKYRKANIIIARPQILWSLVVKRLTNSGKWYQCSLWFLSLFTSQYSLRNENAGKSQCLSCILNFQIRIFQTSFICFLISLRGCLRPY